MRLVVNGEERDSAASNLGELWEAESRELELPGPRGFAMALNGTVVRQGEWSATKLRDGDKVEIIRAMQGG